MDLQELGTRIKEARQEAGLSQIELADRIGTYKGNISRLENGKHSPSTDTLSKIAKATGKELVIQFK